MPSKQQKLARATRILGKYYGIHSVRDLSERVALDSVRNYEPSNSSGDGTQDEGSDSFTVARPTEAEGRLIETLIDTSEGALLTTTFYDQVINTIQTAEGDPRSPGTESNILVKDVAKLLQMHYEPGKNFALQFQSDNINTNLPSQFELDGDETVALNEVGVRQMLGYSAPGGDSNVRINSTPSQPTKNSPGLSVYISNSKRVTLESQNTAPATIFLNGIPNVELQRAVPYVNVEFFFPRGPKSSTGQLQNLSLNKFLLGGVKPNEGSALDLMTEADTVAGSEISSRNPNGREPIPDRYSRAGMELFTAPQTLVNADDDAGPSVRANPILDKFRPLMSLSELSLSIQPSRGLMSFKNGSLSFILHDRSRLPEVAEFIRADLYGTNEITIEYGWSHPDGESNTSDNPYGDLINGMRVKEKYMVVNSSFNFEPTGEVSIKLNIAMRGASEFNTELMSSDNETFSNAIREIEELQREIAELRQRAFPASTATTSVEIRGRQILDAAQDAINNPILGSDLRDALKDFRRAYSRTNNPSARQLLDKIDELYGDQVRRRRRRQDGDRQQPSGQPTQFAKIRKSIQESIQRKVENLQSTPDPFILTDVRQAGQRFIKTTVPRTERRAQRNFERSAFTANVENARPVSLGKLLLTFVGEPLANTGNYDEVQMFFYPFNEYAGAASKLNIANFPVDIEYFADELARYRLEHISRSSVMSLRQFMNFVADILVDDPAANAYGLVDDEGSLYRQAFQDDEGRVRSTIAAEENPAEFRIRMERLLQGVTPDGSFRMPQVGIYIETLPEKTGLEDGEDAEETNGRTILRLHVFDQTATTYESLGRILLATRRNEIRAIGSLPNVRGGNQSVVDNNKIIASTTLNAAINIGLLEEIPNNSNAQRAQESSEQQPDPASKTYRITGGSQKLKEFIMSNTPYIIYGAGGTTVKAANLASMQNSQLSTVNLLRSMRREEQITPNGENTGGLPMQVIPTQLSMECIGNPLLNFMQTYFIDFQTGTTADNLYAITGVEHKFIQAGFDTSVRFAPMDAWGTYRSLISTVGNSLDVLRDVDAEENEGSENTSGNSPAGGQ